MLEVEHTSSYLLIHVRPSPRYPGLQRHWNDPGTLKQAAFSSHVFRPIEHSSRSVERKNTVFRLYIQTLLVETLIFTTLRPKSTDDKLKIFLTFPRK